MCCHNSGTDTPGRAIRGVRLWPGADAGPGGRRCLRQTGAGAGGRRLRQTGAGAGGRRRVRKWVLGRADDGDGCGKRAPGRARTASTASAPGHGGAGSGASAFPWAASAIRVGPSQGDVTRDRPAASAAGSRKPAAAVLVHHAAPLVVVWAGHGQGPLTTGVPVAPSHCPRPGPAPERAGRPPWRARPSPARGPAGGRSRLRSRVPGVRLRRWRVRRGGDRRS